MDHPAYYRHATCLIKREDGPSDYIDDRFTQDVWSTHGYPGLKEFLQTSGIVIQMRVGLRVVAWEKLAGWPYSDIFCRIYDAEYPNVVSPETGFSPRHTSVLTINVGFGVGQRQCGSLELP